MRFLRSIFLLGVTLAAGRVANAEAPSEGMFIEGTQVRQESRPFHPEPRVIVNVTLVQGPHDAGKLQTAARLGWTRIVRCYKLSGRGQRVVISLELVVSPDGSVASARDVGTDPKYRDLGGCLVEAVQGLTMPKAPAESTATVEIKLAPGDPPPKKALRPTIFRS